MTPDLIKLIIADQQDEQTQEQYVQRERETSLLPLMNNKEIIVLTGVRRCGKSVLLQHIRQQSKEFNYYFNFEDERLVTFTVEHFQILHEVLIELFGLQNTFFFDEIQNIPGWELFVRRLYNNGAKIYITGSNASLFSEELGTRLTGRYISVQVYPYSFYEFVQYKASNLLTVKNLSTRHIGQLKQLFNEYATIGGIPEYVNFENPDYLHSLYQSIIYRDIIARYKLPNDKTILELVFYLASNCSKETTYSSLRKLLSIGSASTVADYCHYLENSFLCFFVNRMSASVKAQLQSPKKVYFIDHRLAKLIGFRLSEDRGRMLENLVFIELKRQGYDIYYHREKKECDFVLRKNGTVNTAIQVCQSLENAETRKCEFEGLIEALELYSLTEGLILTESNEETVMLDNHKISIMPIWKWLLHLTSDPLLFRK